MPDRVRFIVSTVEAPGYALGVLVNRRSGLRARRRCSRVSVRGDCAKASADRQIRAHGQHPDCTGK